MATVLLSFADSRLAGSLRRLKAQAKALGLFDRVIALDELGLDGGFVRARRAVFAWRTRGFGYWTWKPHLIARELARLRDGDTLVYSDAGNHFEPARRERLAEYVGLARRSPARMLAPVLSNRFPEREWTKREVLRCFEVEADKGVLDSPQFEANFIVIVASPEARALVGRWNGQDMGLFDDSLRLEQDEAFKDHRHDQSVFSILAKLHGVAAIPPDIDDFVLRRRDKVAGRSLLVPALFFLKNGLLLTRLTSRP